MSEEREYIVVASLKYRGVMASSMREAIAKAEADFDSHYKVAEGEEGRASDYFNWSAF